MIDVELGDLTKLSRVELEAVMHRMDCRWNDPPQWARADVIRAELATRTWQHLNPYADWLPA